ncbi:uncharacterized protein LOC127243630 [Andrographis paniculata]|uniref:uncharacterized protein LOC127243630 n=1 Tax=Andrographis paniculata TaxID=175694 RepID=UPI0021E9149D|nr:uncharacterized protein LOC127243630 [Andrographis paniculata]
MHSPSSSSSPATFCLTVTAMSENQNPSLHPRDEDGCTGLLSSYLGLSFALFLGTFPNRTIPLLQTLQTQNKALAFRLLRAEEELRQLHSRRKEDSKANARVVEIFASHRHAWQQEEKRLLQQIDDCSDEIAYLKAKIEGLEGEEADLNSRIDDLKREIGERDEMLSFVSSSNCEMETRVPDACCYADLGLRFGKQARISDLDLATEDCYDENGVDDLGHLFQHNNNGGYPSDFLSSAAAAAAPNFWSEKASLWQDMQYEPVEPLYHMKHFTSRRESPWKVDGDSTGVSTKLKLLEQELMNLERVGKADLSKLPSQMRKQAKRYQALAGKIDDLCRRMQASDPCESTLSSEFRTQRQTEFLLEAFRLQQRASETNQKLMSLQAESTKNYHGGEVECHAKLATRRSLDSIRNNFKEIQRNLEIWLARIIGDLEGILARDGASRVREYYLSRFPLVQ